jgi:hypothetical protein
VGWQARRGVVQRSLAWPDPAGEESLCGPWWGKLRHDEARQARGVRCGAIRLGLERMTRLGPAGMTWYRSPELETVGYEQAGYDMAGVALGCTTCYV